MCSIGWRRKIGYQSIDTLIKLCIICREKKCISKYPKESSALMLAHCQAHKQWKGINLQISLKSSPFHNSYPHLSIDGSMSQRKNWINLQKRHNNYISRHPIEHKILSSWKPEIFCENLRFFIPKKSNISLNSFWHSKTSAILLHRMTAIATNNSLVLLWISGRNLKAT